MLQLSISDSTNKVGAYNRSEIGGIFRNSEGNILLHFAKNIKADPTIHVKVLAIKEDMLIVIAS